MKIFDCVNSVVDTVVGGGGVGLPSPGKSKRWFSKYWPLKILVFGKQPVGSVIIMPGVCPTIKWHFFYSSPSSFLFYLSDLGAHYGPADLFGGQTVYKRLPRLVDSGVEWPAVPVQHHHRNLNWVNEMEEEKQRKKKFCKRIKYQSSS